MWKTAAVFLVLANLPYISMSRRFGVETFWSRGEVLAQ